MSSITGLGLRNKVGLGKSKDSSAKPKQQGSSITGLGLRNKASGLTGNRKGPEQVERDHVVTPRSALIDPSSFAPPPKNANYYGAAAEERQVDRIAQKGPLTPAEYQAREKEKASRERDEAAGEKEQRRLEREAKQSLRSAQQGEEDAHKPRLPYRNDTTGLATTQFAPPVARSTAGDGTIVIRPTAPSKANAKPRLPPRLPERQNSSPETRVTDLGYGSQEQYPTQHGGRPQVPARVGTGSSPRGLASTSENPQLGELQSRFAHLKASAPKTEAKSQGTMWAAQSTIRPTFSLRDDPAPNSGLDAHNFVPTSKSFREGHAEQIATGRKPATTLNEKYRLSDNAVSHSGSVQKRFEQGEEVRNLMDSRDNTMLLVKKTPPPKPKKRAELSGISTMTSNI